MINVTKLAGWSDELRGRMAENVFGDINFEEAMAILENIADDDYEAINIDMILTVIGAAYGALFMRWLMSEFVDEKTRYTKFDSDDELDALMERAMIAMDKGLKQNSVRYTMSD